MNTKADHVHKGYAVPGMDLTHGSWNELEGISQQIGAWK